MSADPVSLALTAIGTLVSGVLSIGAGNQQAQQNEQAAAQARQDAELQRQTAAAEVVDLRRSHRRQMGAIRANAAASGLLVDDGAALEAALVSAGEAELEALRRKWQGDVGAQRSETEAAMFDARAREARSSGLFRAGAQLLTGGSRIYNLLGGGFGGGLGAAAGDGRKPGSIG